jgi:hypothetical protein
MLAPVALYPDPLLAVLLPASTQPSEIASAAQYIASGGSPTGIDAQAWDPSVKGLAHYPEVLRWMNDNADWTRALGAAFAMQPSDVMKSVQQLRARARAAGTLVNTPQQSIEMEGDDIRIVPAQPETIYVPEYDPGTVYDGSDSANVTFGIGYPVGAWLGYECDWDDYGIWLGPWQPGWGYRRDWNDGGRGSRWHPDSRSARSLVRNYYRPGGSLPSPRLTVRAAAHAAPARTFERAPAPAEAGRADFRGYESPPAARAPSAAPRSPLFGSYGRGTQVRDNSSRGHASRQAPVRGGSPARSGSSAPAGNRERH